MQKTARLLFWIIICEGIGILGSVFTISQITTWYALLQKPFFSPPNWVFGPVWTTLYAFMGVSIFLIYEAKIKPKEKNTLQLLFFFQLFLNFAWSVIFFGMHLIYPAFIEIIFLWGTILFIIIKFWKHSKVASYFLVPYLLWVSFASLLNLSVGVLN